MENYDVIASHLDRFSEQIGKLCPGELPDLGAMITSLESLVTEAKTVQPDTFLKVAKACKGYVESMTLEEIHTTRPLEEGLILLKALLRHLKKGAEFVFDISDIIEILYVPTVDTKKERKAAAKAALPTEPLELQEPKKQKEPTDRPQQVEVLEPFADDDLEILADFVAEAEENLDTIEILLVELEQDPSDKEIINNIFRPFHTIKGVSGFLSLKKINTLSHSTENLLDGARSGEFLINDRATNAILESVDTLKALLSRLRQGVAQGVRLSDDDLDVETLRERLQALQVSLIKGDREPLGEILIRKGVIDKASLEESLEHQNAFLGKKIGEILVESNKAESRDIAAALMDQKTVSKPIAAQVKVSTQKLDDLVDYAGELVIAQSMLKQRASNDASLTQSIVQLGQIVTNMQTIAMSMRMIPIKATFMKMIRLVRDLSQKSGKKVGLTMVGEETEIDRNVVDALYEPMVHMIRNSVDHGIESGEERKKGGKSSQGSIVLRAYHKGGHIIIEIEDDGKGLDRNRILEKAVSTGLVSEEEKLSDSQIYDLILQPGFSTAKTITDVSGRGVGMDVVKGGIEKFRGNLAIHSSMGKGTKFVISLPLTLAIIDGMLVRVGSQRYVIPTTAIQRVFRPDKTDCFTVKGKGEMIKEKNSLIPLIRLKAVYGLEDDRAAAWESLAVVVESKDETRGVLIDELLGKDEYVIKSLGGSLEEITGFSGGAILADGRVGLILDIHGIFKMAGSSS